MSPENGACSLDSLFSTHPLRKSTLYAILYVTEYIHPQAAKETFVIVSFFVGKCSKVASKAHSWYNGVLKMVAA